MPRQSIRRLGLATRRLAHPIRVSIADGSVHMINLEAKLRLRIGSYECEMWVHESAGTLPHEDMLLGMEWLNKENPKICFRPLSMMVRGHDLTKPKPLKGFCGEHGYHHHGMGGNPGYGAAGGRRPLVGGETKVQIAKDLMDELRKVAGFGEGLSGGYEGWVGRGFGRRLIPVFRHEEATNDDGPLCHEKDDTKDEDEKKWFNWKEIFPVRSWLKPDSKVKVQGSVISRTSSKTVIECREGPSLDDARDTVIEWLAKDDVKPGSRQDDVTSSDAKDDPLHPFKHGNVSTAYDQRPNGPPTGKTKPKLDANRTQDKLKPPSHAPKHVSKDVKVKKPSKASENDTKRVLPAKDNKKRPETYELFH